MLSMDFNLFVIFDQSASENGDTNSVGNGTGSNSDLEDIVIVQF